MPKKTFHPAHTSQYQGYEKTKEPELSPDQEREAKERTERWLKELGEDH